MVGGGKGGWHRGLTHSRQKYCNIYQADPRAAFRGHLNVRGCRGEWGKEKRYMVQSHIWYPRAAVEFETRCSAVCRTFL